MSCIRNKKVRNLFPLNNNENKNTRNREKYKINFANTERYKTEVTRVKLELTKCD